MPQPEATSSRSRRNSPPRSSDKPSPSPSKKRKTEQSHPTPSTPLKSGALPADNMYKFTSNYIDLTGSGKSSPNGSPSSRRSTDGVQLKNATASNGPKQLVVKNFRTTTKFDPEQYFRNTWNELEHALDIIFSKRNTSFSIERLYKGVENICRQDKASKLFLKLQAKCKSNVAHVKDTLIASSEGKSNVEILGSVIEAWNLWKSQMGTIRRIFYYMDRAYLLHASNLPNLEHFGIKEFRDNIFHDLALREPILGGACDYVAQARDENGSERYTPSLLKDAIEMFHTLTVYTKYFEPLLLRKSQDFFHVWAEESSAALELSIYVGRCNDLFCSEITRCEEFGLDDSTKRNLINLMETALVEEKKERLVRREDVKHLLKENNVTALTSLYDFLEKKRLGDDLKDAIVQYIYEDGESIIFDEDRISEMVGRLLHLKGKMDLICESAFGKNPDLTHSVREAFAVFMNKTKKTQSTWDTDNDKPGEMIAKYVDLILKGGSRAIPKSIATVPNTVHEDDIDDNDEVNEESQINQQLDQVLDLFRFVNGKAVFEAFYKKDLAKRLLMNRSASADAEKSMLDKLSKACGQGFTQNLETMFKDIELGREENASYKTMLEDSGRKPTIDLSVNVLSAAAWPTYPTIDVVIPKDVNRAIDAFQGYYKLKHKGRLLDWKHSLAHCQMKARFPAGNKDIIVSSFQAIVMLHFNSKADGETVSYQELAAATKLPDVELIRTLQSLACAKYRVLTKTPRGKNVNKTDTFAINLKFTDPRARIKINQIQLKETREENKQTHERVAIDRQYETQAAIVRIMKREKRVKHNNLILEVIEALKSRGYVSPEDIKKQIGKLIEKDYMERADGDEQTYEYVS